MDRRLSAVLVLDLVGYSRLMHGDEDATFRVMKALQSEIIAPRAAQYGGRIVKLTGDGALIEFSSVIEAVTFAVVVQLQMAQRNETANAATTAFRVGLHFADVIRDSKDIFGDGVNVAARLETQAPPGGILISRAVRDQIRDRLDLTLEDRGEIELKNIQRPVRAFAIALDEKAVDLAQKSGTARRRTRRRLIPLAASIVVLGAVAATTAAVMIAGTTAPVMVATGQTTTQPTIAVLPFADVTEQHDETLFSEGVSTEIRAILSRSPYLAVINPSSSPGDIPADSPADVARRLGARYLVKGSVWRRGDQLRVVAELIDAANGGTLWTGKYDRPLDGVFGVQDEIAASVAAMLDDRIERAELLAASRKPPSEVSNFDLFLRARSIMASSYGKEPTLEARSILEDVVAREPAWAPPYAWLAFTYYREMSRRWSDARREEALEKGFAAVSEALKLDPSLPFANLTMANLLIKRGEHEEAIRWAEKAIALDPNNPEAYAALANILAFVNRAGEGIPLMDKAFRLDPLHPPLYDLYMGRAHLLSGDFSGSLPYLRDCLLRQPDSWPCHQYLAVAALNAGDARLAASEFAQMKKTNYPFTSIEDMRARGDLQPGPQTALLLDGLAALGMPTEAR